MTDLYETGPIDWLLVEFKGKEINGELVPPLLDLVDRRIIRILDALIVVKRADGSFETMTSQDLDSNQVGDLGALSGASSGLIAEEDAEGIAAVLEPDTVGLALIFENLWAAPFAIAAREAGGQMISNGRIPVQALLARLDELEA
jgi:Family of unknown function (DUF6325)